MKRTILARTAAVLLAFSGAGTAFAAPLRVAVPALPLLSFPMTFAEKEGYFSREGVEVQTITVSSGALSLMLAGGADVAVGAPESAFMSRKEKMKIIATIYQRLDYFALSRYKPEEAGSIKAVAVSTAGVEARLVLEPFLAHFDFPGKPVARVPVRGEDAAYALLESGAVDLAVFSSPVILKKARQAGKYQYLPASSLAGRADARTIGVPDSVLRARGPDLEKFVAAYYRAVRAAAADRTKTVSYLRSDYGYSAQEAEDFYVLFSSAVAQMDYVPRRERMFHTAGKLNRAGRFKKKEDLDGLFYDGYAIKAVR